MAQGEKTGSAARSNNLILAAGKRAYQRSRTEMRCGVYRVGMWQYALWGIAGAAANCGIAYLEDSERVKGWPWPESNRGPGGAVYLSWVLVHLSVAGVTTWAVASAAIITTIPAAFGAGVAAPALVKKLASYGESLAPRSIEEAGNFGGGDG